MAAALSASSWGPSRGRARARAGREPGKIQPLSAARVTHGAGTSGPASGSLSAQVQRAGRLWGLGQGVAREAPQLLARASPPPPPAHMASLPCTPHSSSGLYRTRTHQLVSLTVFLELVRRYPKEECPTPSLHVQNSHPPGPLRPTRVAAPGKTQRIAKPTRRALRGTPTPARSRNAGTPSFPSTQCPPNKVTAGQE